MSRIHSAGVHPIAPKHGSGASADLIKRAFRHAFVTDGIEAALEGAKRPAGSKDVSLAGGAKAAQQYLVAGLVDEMEIHLVPTLFGSGERVFDGVGDDLHGLELVQTVAASKVTHLKFARR